jgi:3-dehydroquinate synthetase
MFAAMKLDKKVSSGEVKFVLASKIGRVEFGRQVPKALIEESLIF